MSSRGLLLGSLSLAMMVATSLSRAASEGAPGAGDVRDAMAPATHAVSVGPGLLKPDFSGKWALNAAASDDPMEKARDGVPTIMAQPGGGHCGNEGRAGGRGKAGALSGMGGGAGMEPARGAGGMGGRPGMGRGGMGPVSGGRPRPGAAYTLSRSEIVMLLTPARDLHIAHEEPEFIVSDGKVDRRPIFTDFRATSVSASTGLEQPIVVAGWQRDALVVETTMAGTRLTQCYRLEGDKLLVFTTAQASGGPPMNYRLVYERERTSRD